MSEILEEIRRETSVAREGTGTIADREAYAQHQLRLADAAEQIARRHGREGVEALLRDPASLSRPLETPAAPLEGRLVVKTVLEVLDPDDAHGLKSAWRGESFEWWQYMAVAGVDLYGDERARDLLIEVAFRDEDSIPAAIGMLRGYDGDAVRPAAEAAKAAMADKKPLDRRLPHIAGLLASLDYAAQLRDPGARQRYQKFERLLWRSWALGSDMAMSRKAGQQEWKAAGLLREHLRDGDERFIVRLLEEPASTPEEVSVAMHLIDWLPPASVERLREIAAGDSPVAERVRAALDWAERRGK